MTTNKILDAVQEHIEFTFNIEHSLLRDALNHIFWSDQKQDHLVPPELIEDLITLISNPVEYEDCYLTDISKSDKLKDAFRKALREHKDDL